jgi:rubrerythrin
MVGEVFAGIGAFKTMFDIAKSLKDMDDAVRRNTAVADLGEQIISAQTRYAASVEQVRDLEEKLRSFETWEREKQRYDLKDLGWGAFAYMLKPPERGSQPPTWKCTNCYEHDRIATMQNIMVKGTGQTWTCPSCRSTINPSTHGPAWIDRNAT